MYQLIVCLLLSVGLPVNASAHKNWQSESMTGVWTGYLDATGLERSKITLTLRFFPNEPEEWRLKSQITITSPSDTEVVELAMPEGDHWNGFNEDAFALNFVLPSQSRLFPQKCFTKKITLFGPRKGYNKKKIEGKIGHCIDGTFKLSR